MTVILLILTIGNVLCLAFKDNITKVLNKQKKSAGINAESVEVCKTIEEEGVVLLKNDYISSNKKSLPLSEDNKKVNIFGWGATDAGFVQTGIGSSASLIYESTNTGKDRNVTLLEAFENAGYEYNKEIINAYKNFRSVKRETNRGTLEAYRLYEPTTAFYSTQMINNAKNFSNTAIVVISRISGENTTHDQNSSLGEIPTVQDRLYTEFGLMEADISRTYLELTKYEENLINLCSANFSNVILVINSTNTMHLNILNTNTVDSAISIGVTGECGASVVPDILWGKTNPSGKLTSTHVYDPTTDPSYVNHTKQDLQIQYLEDIYIGYKWYETADAEGFWNSDYAKNKWGIVNGYDDVVQYPFGYGLSYTQFEWKVDNLSIANGGMLNKNRKIEFDVTVKNTGEVAGKDVVQIYLQAPYRYNGIEKSASKLIAFFKTPELEPNEKYKHKISIDLYDLASYDAYDKNNNGFSGYEIENIPGEYYQIKVMTDAHTLKNCQNNIIRYNVVSDGIKFENDPTTESKVENRLTGNNAYANCPIDGSTVGAETKYLSRSNFQDTFPTSHAKTPTNLALIYQAYNYVNQLYNQTEMPKTDIERNLRLFIKKGGGYATKQDLEVDSNLVANDELMFKLADYDNTELWNKLINQMTISELKALVEDCGFSTPAIESIGKPKALEKDGTQGLNNVIFGDNKAQEEWTVFPSQSVVGCTWNDDLSYLIGCAVGKEANKTANNGWNAPSVNLYRSAYNGRNFENYSEDTFLSGKMAAQVIIGAKENGVYCYLKHFVVAELGVNPYLVKTWLTEQNLRENYLKPFEIAVKQGEANAIMSSFNCVGATWAGSNYALLTQILRNEWGFKGTVLTDYNKIGYTFKCSTCVRAGNDALFDPRGNNTYPLSALDPTDIYCAKMAAKNIIYTYVSTYVYAKQHDPNFSYKFIGKLTQWWVLVLISINTLIIVTCSTYIVLTISVPKILKKIKS